MNTQGITKITGAIGGFVTRNSPTILTGMGVAGLLTTTIMGISATPKALAIIENTIKDRNPDRTLEPDADYIINMVTKKEALKLTWKCYVPTAIMGAITIGCIIGANSISLRKNAALASLYSLSETALKEYKDKVVETIGKNREKELRSDLAKERVERNPVSKSDVIITGKGDNLCYDDLSGRYFRGDVEDIKAAINNVNKRLMNENFLYLNEVYSELNLEQTKMGDLVGFYVDDNLIEVDFHAVLADDGRPCLAITFNPEPRYYKREY